MHRQLTFWSEEACEPAEQSNEIKELTDSYVQTTVKQQLEVDRRYTSLKCVSLIRTGSIEGRPKMTSPDGSKELFKQYWNDYPGNDQERFVIACLDTKNRVQCVVQITVGTLDASLVHPREVFKPAILQGSSAIILSHNHPSGDPTPSREDHSVTDRLTEVGELLGITVLDHIIHGDGAGTLVSIRES